MAEEKKSESKQLKEKLFASKKHGALRMSEDDQTACEALCKDYMAFLNQSKTEREACANATWIWSVYAGYGSESRR